MNYQSIILLILINICFAYAIFEIQKSSDNFGPFEVLVNKYEVCKGPKLKNSAIFQMVIEKDEKGDYIFKSNLTFLENSDISQIKIKALLLKSGKSSTLLNYQIQEPCEHFMIASLLQKHLNVGKNCAIKKGTYSITFNYTESQKKFFGSAFFYGEYLFKAVVTSKKGNVACLHINLGILKVDKKV